MPRVIEVDQSTDQWKQERIGLVTASKAAEATMAPSTAGYQKYLTQLAFERVTGEMQDSGYYNDYMQDGHDFEPIARLQYSLEREEAKETGFWRHDHLQVGASPDGLVGEDGLIEIKCVENHIHMPALMEDKVPSHYYKQIQFQLWITERNWCDYVSYAKFMPTQLSDLQMKVIRVERNEKAIEEMIKKTVKFLQKVDELQAKLEAAIK